MSFISFISMSERPFSLEYHSSTPGQSFQMWALIQVLNTGISSSAMQQIKKSLCD